MSKGPIPFERLEAFRLLGVEFTSHSKWNGLQEWRDKKDRKLIVMTDKPPLFSGIFEEILGQEKEPETLVIVLGDQDLLHELLIAREQRKPPEC